MCDFSRAIRGKGIAYHYFKVIIEAGLPMIEKKVSDLITSM
jgi:hypothetical protein